MPEVKSVSFSHDAIILWMLENPHRSLRDCAEYFNYTQAWLSCVIHSDVFQEKLRQRQDEAAAAVIADIPAKLRGLAHVAIDKLGVAIEKTEDKGFLLDATDKILHRCGYAPASARNPGAVQVTNQTQINVISSDDLAAARALMTPPAQSPVALPSTIDGEKV